MNRPEGFSLEFPSTGGAPCDARWRPAQDGREHPLLLAHGAGAGHELALLAALEAELASEGQSEPVVIFKELRTFIERLLPFQPKLHGPALVIASTAE